MVKRRDIRSRHVWIREMNENEPSEASKETRCPQNRGLPYVSGAAWQIPTYGPCGDRCRGGMTLIQAFVRNLRTGLVMLRDKAQSGEPTRPKVPMHWPGAHCFVVARKRSNVRGAKGAGHPCQDGVNGQPEELLVLAEGGSLLWGGTSRMNREVHVRICERLGVKFPGPTRPVLLRTLEQGSGEGAD